ncbi:MAG: arylesterase [gamma proteobacterium symbiont of Phacoides pectinatus]
MKYACFLLLLFNAAVSHAAEPVILVFGDSLSAAYGVAPGHGWVALFEQRLARRGYPYRVVNASVSGDTTAGGLSRLPAALNQFNPSLLLLELGGNDGLRGLSLERTRDNLRQMIRLGRKRGGRVVLFAMRLPPNYGSVFTERFQGIYDDLAAAERVTLVPFFLNGVAERSDWMQSDGLHPNALGQGRMLENVWVVLEPLLRGPVARAKSP